MGTDPAHPQAQACKLADSADDSSFRFTPIKAIRALPRLWERKQATPFKGGLKPRKLWKRFQTSFSNMQTLQDTTAIIENDALQTAINTSKDSNYVRGTKRMRVGSEEIQNRSEAPQAGRSFFETKWDSEAARKKRKLPDSPFDIFDEKKHNTPLFSESQFDGPAENTSASEISKNIENVNMAFATTASSRPFGMPQGPQETPVYQDDAHAENSGSSGSDSIAAIDQEPSLAVEEQSADGVEDLQSARTAEVAPTPTKAVRGLTQEQKGKLVRSALRSSLDGEDAELLNDFLSKAKAKRAAKATLMNAQESDVDVSEKSSSSEDSPDAECVTARSRRALEDLDTNSPSPIKVQVSPSKKADMIPEDATREIVAKKDLQDDEQAPGSPAYRRSTRVKAPPVEAPAAPNTISLRRAKGTEFVFLQRTETQELALATKRNTRNNRGKSVMPKYVLEAMSQHNELSGVNESDRPGRKERKGTNHRQSRKNVSWNEERLAEYEDEVPSSESQGEEEGAISRNDVGGTSRARSGAKKADKAMSSSRSSRSQVQQETRDESTNVESGPTTSTSAAPRSRRVRRLGESTMTSSTPVKTGSGRISKPPVAPTPAVAAGGPSTPTKSRRKLVPKSPNSSMLPTPATKSSEQSFASGIPTRSIASEGPKRKSMLEASAGCTPMPKRVRART